MALDALMKPAELSFTTVAAKKRSKGLEKREGKKLSKPRVPTGPVKAQKPLKRRRMLSQLVRGGVGRKG